MQGLEGLIFFFLLSKLKYLQNTEKLRIEYWVPDNRETDLTSEELDLFGLSKIFWDWFYFDFIH